MYEVRCKQECIQNFVCKTGAENVKWVSEEKEVYGPIAGFVNVRNFPDL
jgi:hypothetical protein